MDWESFQASVRTDGSPPRELSAILQAAWFAARGQWDMAHTIVQDRDESAACWLHAHLHRREGDLDNATYWYRRAYMEPMTEDLDAELEDLIREQLES